MTHRQPARIKKKARRPKPTRPKRTYPNSRDSESLETALVYTTPARAAAARAPLPTCFIGCPQKQVGAADIFRWTGVFRLLSSGVRLMKFPGVS
jgi:hypothetical protein